MCGIFCLTKNINLNKEDIFKIIQKISHRGPDDEGYYEDENIVLGQRRLAIIDLSPSGKQPMRLNCSKSNRQIYLVFNGEIYNYQELKKELINLGHKFFSNSDTEVILHSYEEWQEASFSKLRGMFACVLYDKDKNEILLFRDRFGIKPLYYYFKDNKLIIFSELKALKDINSISKEINYQAVFDFLKYGYIIQPKTFFQDIQFVEAGSFLKFKIENNSLKLLKSAKFAHLLDFYLIPEENLSLKEAIELTKNSLIDSLKHHLIADVEVGLFLSGGIDSSTLLCLLNESGFSNIKTVSAIFPKTSYDESSKIKELIEIFKPNHLEFEITSQDFLGHLDKIFYFMDQPTIDGVNTYFISLVAKKAGLKVVLSGLGGDELFYGYPSFFDLKKLQKFKLLAKIFQTDKFINLISSPFNIKLSKLKKLIQAKNLKEEYLIYRSIFTEEQIKKILNPEISKNFKNHKGEINPSDINSFFKKISYFEMNYYLKNQLLRDSDVFSMAHSLELRVPFVDNILFEKIVPIPDKYKIKNNQSKFLLKEILKNKVSEKILNQKKQGFVVPLELWIKDNKELIKSEILNNKIYNQEITEMLYNLFLENKLHWSRIWALFVLNRFLK